MIKIELGITEFRTTSPIKMNLGDPQPPWIYIELGGTPKGLTSPITMNVGAEPDAPIIPGYKATLNLPLTGDANTFNSGLKLITPEPPPIILGYKPTLDLPLTGDINTFNSGLKFGTDKPIDPTEPTIPVPTVITSTYTGRYGKATPLNTSTETGWERSRSVDVSDNLVYGKGTNIDSVAGSAYEPSFIALDVDTSLGANKFQRNLDISTKLNQFRTLYAIDKSSNLVRNKVFKEFSNCSESRHVKLGAIDIMTKDYFNAVALYGVKRDISLICTVPEVKPVEGYKPTLALPLKNESCTFNSGLKLIEPLPLDYIDDGVLRLRGKRTESDCTSPITIELFEPKVTEIHDVEGYKPTMSIPLTDELNTFNSGLKLIEPKYVEKPFEPVCEEVINSVTPIQPVTGATATDWNKTRRIDVHSATPWGYDINKHLNHVTTYPTDPEYVEPEPTDPKDPWQPPQPDNTINHIPYEVYRIMNTVNIKEVVSDKAISFVNFSMTRDIDSFTWSFSFDVLDDESYALVRPQGRVLKDIQIEINGLVIKAFVNKTNTGRSASANGHVSKAYRCTAFSDIRKLSNKYSVAKSHTTTTEATAAQLVGVELAGTGHSVEWEAIDWTVPANVHSYQNKTPMGAILSITNAIGAVIVPHLSNKTFKVRPRFPVSPWNWNDAGTTVNRTMSERQFFSIDNESIPIENPDSAYVYGSVGVHCVRIGKPGSKPVADVVDEYITHIDAGQERGRQEVAKQSFLEIIPMKTYVDNSDLIMPQDLIEFTEIDNVTKWRGMVISTDINCQRIGTAITQTLTVARYHE